MIMWLFSKLFPPKIQTPTNQANNKHTVMLHGFDLSAWDYLGYTTLFFNVKGKKEYPSNCFFFVNKKNPKKKQYHFSCSSTYIREMFHAQHVWIHTVIPLWMAGEKQDYEVVTTQPSQWFLDKILREKKWSFNYTTNWWENASEDQKFKLAAEQQKKKKPKTSKSSKTTINETETLENDSLGNTSVVIAFPNSKPTDK